MSSYRDKVTLGSFAKIAADEYLGKGKRPLNDTLKKIATQEHLTPHQIEFVAAETNKSVWSKLFALDKTASYDFPLADAKEIIAALQTTQSPETLKSADLDYLSPPSSTKVAAFDPFEALGIQEDALVKSAAARKEIKRQLQTRFEKLSAAREELDRLMTVSKTKAEDLELAFVKSARSMVMEVPFEERKNALEKVAEFLRGSGNPAYGRHLMKKLSHVLVRQGLVKEGDLKAPEQYISDKLPARVINGTHSLYITLKTLYDKYDYIDNLGSRYEIVDSSLPVIKEKIRAL